MDHITIKLRIDVVSSFGGSPQQLWSILGPLIDHYLFLRWDCTVAWGNRRTLRDIWVTWLTNLEVCWLLGSAYFSNPRQFLWHWLADTPGKAMIKRIKHHSGYYSSNCCTIRGGSVDGHDVYCGTYARKRTDVEFSSWGQEEHHIGDSPFEELPLDISESPDKIHANVVHRDLQENVVDMAPIWNTAESNASPSGGQTHYGSYPSDSHMHPVWISQVISDNGWYRLAVAEHCQFLQFIGTVVLTDVISEDNSQHFLDVLVTARVSQWKVVSTLRRLHRTAIWANFDLFL